jgi:hypothetical protein
MNRELFSLIEVLINDVGRFRPSYNFATVMPSLVLATRQANRFRLCLGGDVPTAWIAAGSFTNISDRDVVQLAGALLHCAAVQPAHVHPFVSLRTVAHVLFVLA